jgi:ABC-2 type transport system permease protein
VSAAEVASPIRDTSYRNYDGPLRRRLRWWIVALAGIRIAVSRWYFWVVAAFGLIPYLNGGFVILFQESNRQRLEELTAQAAMFDPSAAAQVPQLPPFAVHFYQAGAGIKVAMSLFGQSFVILLLALIVGSATIAADTRSNALLVYLSKPLTRVDYLFGKWMSIFVMLYAVCVTPALLLYAFCYVSYAATGFFKNEPYLIAQLIAAAAVPPMIHASLIIGCSAWSRSGRIAGATYAGLYFVTNAIVFILWGIFEGLHPSKGLLLRSFSIQGLIEGLQQNIYHVTFHAGGFSRRMMSAQNIDIPPPDGLVLGLLAVAICSLAMWLAWVRIRAVEVVTG